MCRVKFLSVCLYRCALCIEILSVLVTTQRRLFSQSCAIPISDNFLIWDMTLNPVCQLLQSSLQ